MTNDFAKEFLDELNQASARSDAMSVFGDFVEMVQAALEKHTVTDPKLSAAIEAHYMSIVGKYTADEVGHFPRMLGLLTLALSKKRESFLGPILERIGANNKRNGQFLTPACLAGLMAKINVDDISDYKPGHVITVSDPACGGGVTLIAQGEALVARGVRQGDILIEGGDIDSRAVAMTYVELTLLGYAAIVRHVDTLAGKRFAPDRYTIGYFLHSMPFRRGGRAA